MLFPRTLFHYEFPDDGGGAPAAVVDAAQAGAVPLPDAAPGADAGDPAAPSAEAAAPAWVETPEFRDAVNQAAQDAAAEQLHRMLQEQGAFDDPAPTATPGDLSLDPLDESFGTNLAELIRQTVADATAPIRAQEQQQNLAEGEQRVKDIIADFTAREGEFLTEAKQPGLAATTVRQISTVFYAEEAARFGEGPRAAESAIQRAAQLVRQIENAAGEAYHDKQVNQLTQLAGPANLGGGAPAGIEVRPQYANELEAARAFAARTRQT